MDSEKHFAVIDSLCVADLTAAHSGPGVVLAGAGYRVVALEPSDRPRSSDPADQLEAVAALHALRDHISQVLDSRWGKQQPPWGMVTVRVRIDRGEEIPEPWFALSVLVDELNLWQLPGTNRWIAVGVADRSEPNEALLLAIAADVDPV